MHAAAYGGNKDAVRILVAKGADVDAIDANGSTPIEIAKKFKNYKYKEFSVHSYFTHNQRI